ncbi:unnamed protein product, partial [Vitis vinifera]
MLKPSLKIPLWTILFELKMKHISCWNAMIVSLAVHGYCEEALRLFSTMEMSVDGARPNRVTFIGVLIACSHKGLVDEGRTFFNRMVNEYKIMPDIKHYGCMVDLLSRCGLLKEAHHMIKTMPFEANSVFFFTVFLSVQASKILANLIVMGSGILARALVQAYRQALANASKSGVAQETIQNTVRRGSKAMMEQEARQILGVTEQSTWEEILQKYDTLFERNAKNGSFYLQSKVHRAKECLEAVHQGNSQGTPS